MLARPRWPSSRVRGRCSPAAGRPCDIGGQGGAMTIRVGISGFGRVGRAFLRRPSSAMTCRSWPSTTSPTRPLAHPLAFDSTYGRLSAAVGAVDNELTVAGGGRPQGRRPCLGRLPHRRSRAVPADRHRAGDRPAGRRPSPYGSATRTSRPHRSASKQQTWPSGSKPSTAPPRQAPPRAATRPPTSS